MSQPNGHELTEMERMAQASQMLITFPAMGLSELSAQFQNVTPAQILAAAGVAGLVRAQII